jgi:hypothetical protein
LIFIGVGIKISTFLSKFAMFFNRCVPLMVRRSVSQSDNSSSILLRTTIFKQYLNAA